MTPDEFTQIVTFAFRLVAAGAEVKVEPYCCKMPPHVRGGDTSVITLSQGGDRWLVAYDPKFLARGNREFWAKTAFHEACHVGLMKFGSTKEEIKLAEDHVEDCAEKWITWLKEKASAKKKKEK